MARRYARTHPHYVWKNVTIRGGGFVTGIVMHPAERGLAYARTDVGGAYLWDTAAATWAPLLDWLGPADWNLLGVESIAVDPTDARRLYVAAGTYTNPDVGNGEVFRSEDLGRSWRRTPLPFKLGANEAGRGSGERLVVDPLDPHILFLGTRRDGLWQSRDSGATWQRALGFPDVLDGSAAYPPEPGKFNYLSQAVGIVFVRFDPRGSRAGAPTKTMYAAVSTAAESIFSSHDAGSTWEAIPGQPKGLRPNRAALAADGSLFVTYGDEPGPNRMRAGAVYRFDTQGGAWTDVTPERAAPGAQGFGYAGVSADARAPGTVVVSTWNRSNPFDEIFRTRDSGRTWVPMLERAQWDHVNALYTATMRHHWMSDVQIDPFDSDHVLFTTGYGIWATRNATAADAGRPTLWSFDSGGLEETVPLALVSPPKGAHLVSGLGDIDGFRHDDLAESPAAGRFDAPGFKNTESLDFAGRAPDVLVRSGTTYGSDRILGAISRDGGVHWRGFTTEPPRPPESKPFGTGPVAVSADGALIAWTTRGNRPHVSRDDGATWRPIEAAPVDLRLVADRVGPGTFYGYSPDDGVLYVTRDGGATLDAAARGLPIARGWARGRTDLRAVPEREGEVFLAVAGELFLWRVSDPTPVRVESVEDATSVGFGKAAQASRYPAVFLVGRVAGRSGIFRSDDRTATWIRLNDDAHQYGSPSLVTGDPRIFGRLYFATGGRGIVYGDIAE
jgi:hypothetical protein